jgi:ATP-binding cassette subfamily B protein
MSSYQVVWRLMRFLPRLSLQMVLIAAVSFLAPLATGLLLRSFFDTLAGPTAATPAVWWILVLLLAAQTGQQVIVFLRNFVSVVI